MKVTKSNSSAIFLSRLRNNSFGLPGASSNDPGPLVAHEGANGIPVMNIEDCCDMGLDEDGAAREEPWIDVHCGFFKVIK